MASSTLAGRTALIVGGTSGLGIAIAVGFRDAGARVIVASSNQDKVDAAVASLGELATGFSCDLTNPASISALFEQTAVQSISILVCAAGIINRAPAEAEQLADWQRVIAVNLTAPFLCAQHAHRIFRAAGREKGAAILNIASLTTFVALADVTAYSVSKAGIAQLTRSLASDWARYGIRVNAIAPGVFPTEINLAAIVGTPRGEWMMRQTPMGRFGKHDEIAGAAVYLCSDAASFTTGTVLPVDGGFLARGVGPTDAPPARAAAS